MSVNHMFYTEASEKKRNKGEDQEIMSEFFAVCTHRLFLLISPQYLRFSIYAHSPVVEQKRVTSIQIKFNSESHIPKVVCFQMNWLPQELTPEQAAIKSVDFYFFFFT